MTGHLVYARLAVVTGNTPAAAISLLVDDLEVAIREGTRTACRRRIWFHLATARRLSASSEYLLDAAYAEITPEEEAYLPIIEGRVRRGNLSERIVHQVRRRSRKRGGDTTAAIRSATPN